MYSINVSNYKKGPLSIEEAEALASGEVADRAELYGLHKGTWELAEGDLETQSKAIDKVKGNLSKVSYPETSGTKKDDLVSNLNSTKSECDSLKDIAEKNKDTFQKASEFYKTLGVTINAKVGEARQIYLDRLEDGSPANNNGEFKIVKPPKIKISGSNVSIVD